MTLDNREHHAAYLSDLNPSIAHIPKPMTLEEQKQMVREAIAKIQYSIAIGGIQPEESISQILNLTYPGGQKMIEILDEKQELPTNPLSISILRRRKG